MGPMELLLIVVLALMVFGPAKLPEIMGQVGKALGDFRRATSDLSDEFNRTIQAELQETKAVVEEAKSVMGEARSVVTEAKTAVTDVHTSVNAAVAGTPAPTLVAAPGESLSAANGIDGELHGETNGAAPTEATTPLADTTQWSWETSAPAPTTPTEDPEVPSVAESVDAAATADSASPESTSTASVPPEDAPASTSPAPADAPKTGERTARDELQPPY
jgi:sec-independent protein translocase protein TatB